MIENGLNIHSEPIYRFDDGSNGHSTTFDFNKILDRFYLIGDAWHAEAHNLAQGAAVSIEDAWELAYALTSESTLSNAQVKFLDNRRVRIAKYKKFTCLPTVSAISTIMALLAAQYETQCDLYHHS